MATKKSSRKKSSKIENASSAPTEQVRKSPPAWPIMLVILGLLLLIVGFAIFKGQKPKEQTSETNTPTPSTTSKTPANFNANSNINSTTILTNTVQQPAIAPKPSPTPITEIQNVGRIVAFFPDQSTFMFTKDSEGEDLNNPWHDVNLYLHRWNSFVADDPNIEIKDVKVNDTDLEGILTMFHDSSGFGINTWEEKAFIISDKGEVTEIKAPGKYKTSGDFSPDGKTFIYTTTDAEVVKIDVAGNKQTSLGSKTYSSETATGPVQAPSYLAPSYSPDGKWIVFEQYFPYVERTVYKNSSEVAIAILPANAVSIDEMEVIGKSFIIETEGFTHFEFSSDSRFVTHSWSGSIFDLQNKSVVLQADDRYGEGSTQIFSSVFAPTGSRILQTVSQKGMAQLQFLNLPSIATNITPAGNTNAHQMPIWDTEGSAIYSYNTSVNPNIIERVDLLTRQTSTILRSDQKISNLLLSPDGKTLFFSAQTKGDTDLNHNDIKSLRIE